MSESISVFDAAYLASSSSKASTSSPTVYQTNKNVKDHLQSIYQFLSFREGLTVARISHFWYACFKSLKRSVHVGDDPIHVPLRPELLNVWFRSWCDQMSWGKWYKLITPEQATVARHMAPQMHTFYVQCRTTTYIVPIGLINLRHMELNASFACARDVLVVYSQLETVSLCLTDVTWDSGVVLLIKLQALSQVMSPDLRQNVKLYNICDVDHNVSAAMILFHWLRDNWPLAHHAFLENFRGDNNRFCSLLKYLSHSERSMLKCVAWRSRTFDTISQGIKYLADCTSLSSLYLDINQPITCILELQKHHPEVLFRIRIFNIRNDNEDESVGTNLDWLTSMKNLESLSIRFINIDCEKLMTQMMHLPRLIHLELSFHNDPLPVNATNLILARFPQLHSCVYEPDHHYVI